MNPKNVLTAKMKKEKMNRNVEEITAMVREMILEISELKERVAALEQALYQSPEAAAEDSKYSQPAPLSEEVKIRLQGESFENLGRLYTSGYHICPVFFGERNEEECLFCVALLGKR